MSQASPRRRSPTIEDVAREAGVSRAAVSKVIRNASGVSPGMRARVQAAIQRLDYRPSVAARAMRGSSYTLGLEIPQVGNRFFTQLIEGANQVLAGTPYQLVIAPTEGPGYAAIEALVDRQVDGLVAISPRVEADWLEKLAERLPVVMLGRHDEGRSYDTIVGDDVAGTHAVMDHLLRLGHRRIVHLTVPEAATASGGTPHALRMRTYQEAMDGAGLAALREVAWATEAEGSARAATAALLPRVDRPTAIFAGHDELAIGALAAIRDQGLSPHEVSLVGYDNTDLAAHPAISLTSVDQFGVDMGARAVTMLLERIQGRTEPRRQAITPVLRVRGSTAPRSP